MKTLIFILLISAVLSLGAIACDAASPPGSNQIEDVLALVDTETGLDTVLICEAAQVEEDTGDFLPGLMQCRLAKKSSSRHSAITESFYANRTYHSRWTKETESPPNNPIYNGTAHNRAREKV